MKIAIHIRTPKGRAEKVNNRTWFKMLRRMTLRGCRYETKVNEAKDEMVWVVEGATKRVMDVSKQVQAGNVVMKGLLEHEKTAQLTKNYTEQDISDMNYVKENPIDIEIIKPPGDEPENKSFMDKIKFWKKL